MAATGQVTLTSNVIGLLTGSKAYGAITASVSAAVATTLQTNLAVGDNTISIPTGSSWALITPPSTATGILILKGNAGDTGIRVLKTGPFIALPLDTVLPVLILNASIAITGVEILFL